MPKILNPIILFEDNHLIVLSKPSGLLSQGESKGDQNLVDLLRQHVGRQYIGLVHRLDRNTSGLMVVAKRSKSANRLTESLQSGKLIRKYLAWVKGSIAQSFHWRHFLIKNEKTNLVRASKTKSPRSKESLLTGNPIEYSKISDATLVEFTLETGRSHQIRAQSSAEGHPLFGDSKYGGPPFDRLALHSYYLEFPHPMSSEVLTFTDPLPEELRVL